MTAESPQQSPATPGAPFEIGPMRFDPATGELAGPGGRVRLDLKVAEVLMALYAGRGEVISREEILASVWPGLVVTDDVLRRCIYQLRNHLGRAGGDAQFKSLLETLPKRGYRLNVVDAGAPGDSPPPRRGRRAWLAAAGLLASAIAAGTWLLLSQPDGEGRAAVASPSIAVLPFDDLSDAQDQQYFAEGLAEEILNLLAQSPELRVIARTSSFSFRGGGRQDIPAIGRRLGVSHLLLGSVRRSGGRVRVSTRLVRADDGSHAWARTYDRELGDVLAIEREIATDVARTLEIRLAGTTARSGVQAVDPAAHDQYLLARFLWSRRSGGDLAAARAHLERAVSLDPNHAQAWALLSGVRFVQIFPDGADADAALAAMREAVTRAVALAPDSGEVHARAAQYYGAAGDPRRAMEHWERANALAPGDFLVLSFWVGRTLDRGKFEEALEYQRRAIELDPVGALSRYNLVATLAINGRYGEARQELARARRLNPNSPNLELAAAELLVLEGRHVEGLAAARALPAGAERDRLLVLAYGGLGRRTEADAAYAALLARGDPRSLHRIAEVHAWRGDADAAFEWLERAWQAMSAAARVPGERLQPVGFLDSSFLRPLHGDPRLARYFGQPDRELPT